MNTAIYAAALAVPLFVGAAGSAEAGVVYGFDRITDAAGGAAGVDSQLFVEVSAVGMDQVSFLFYNTGSLASSITDIYFDDGELLGIASINDTITTGVSFSQGASPQDLPAGNTIDFNTTAGFLADSDPPAQPKGINPGEKVEIIFDLQSGSDYSAVLAALQLGLDNPGTDKPGGLRIGIHVQGFTNGFSESYVNSTVVPLPAALPILGAALAGFGFAGWRTHRKAD